MPELRITPSLLLRGIRVSAGHAVASLRALDRDRRLALGIGVALLVALGTPWYEVRVIAPGLHGTHRRLAQAMSGWSTLSLSAILCALVAVGTVGLLLVRPGSRVDGLGARGRRAARERADGCLLAGGGGLLVLGLVWNLAGHAAPHVDAVGATGSVGGRWGLVVALLLAAALTAAGVRIARGASAERPADAETTTDAFAGADTGTAADGFADTELWSQLPPRPRAARPGATRPGPTGSEPARARGARTYIQGRRP